jgi:hypothetical protein
MFRCPIPAFGIGPVTEIGPLVRSAGPTPRRAKGALFRGSAYSISLLTYWVKTDTFLNMLKLAENVISVNKKRKFFDRPIAMQAFSGRCCPCEGA